MKVVIIGAGVAGLSIGWRILQAGASVTILERAQPARAATWASAGMIAAGGELGDATTPDAELAHISCGLWPEFAREIEEATGQNVHYCRCGALMVARTADELAAIKLWSGAQLLDAASARSLEAGLSSEIAGAVWAPDEAKVDSRALGDSLVNAFVHLGGTLVANEPVLKIKVSGLRAASVETPFAEYEADAFIVAAGAWSGTFDGLPAEAVPPVRPIKGQMLAISPPADEELPNHIVWGNGVYLVPRGDRLLIGATSEDVGFDTGLSDAAADFLSMGARGLIPALAKWNVVERWAGLRPAAPDGLPLLGRTIVERLFVASGQYRNGILFAPAIAQHLCRIVLHGDAENSAFDPRRFSRR